MELAIGVEKRGRGNVETTRSDASSVSTEQFSSGKRIVPQSQEGSMSQQESDPDVLRMKYTFQIALIGIVGVLMALLMMLLGVAFVGIDKSSMAAVLGIIYGAIGTLAGLVIGHTMGSA